MNRIVEIIDATKTPIGLVALALLLLDQLAGRFAGTHPWVVYAAAGGEMMVVLGGLWLTYLGLDTPASAPALAPAPAATPSDGAAADASLAGDVVQVTHGDNSPAISGVKGAVTMNFGGGTSDAPQAENPTRRSVQK